MTGVRSIVRVVLIGAGALLVGFGVPLAWIWIGSKLQGTTGESSISASTAAVVFVGIVFTYLGLLILFGWLQSRFGEPPEERAGPGPSRHPWNRSMRDEPYRPGERALSPLETLFVTTAVVVSIAFLLWFFIFAGSPLPAQ